MTNLEALLPQRDLRFTRNVLGMGGGYVLGILLLIVAGGFAWWQAPGLIEDMQIRSNPLELEDYQLRDGRCTTRKAVLTDCEADVAYMVDGERYEKHISLMFVSFSRGDYEASLIVAADDPSKASLSIGLERFWNRVGFFALLFGGFAIGGLYSLVATARNRKVSQASQRPQRWTPELVEIKAAQSSFGGTLVTYAYGPETGRRAPKENSRFGKKEEPLLLETADGEMRALALRPAAGGKPLLLDDGLRRIDLTETEREAAFAVLNGKADTPV